MRPITHAHALPATQLQLSTCFTLYAMPLCCALQFDALVCPLCLDTVFTSSLDNAAAAAAAAPGPSRGAKAAAAPMLQGYCRAKAVPFFETRRKTGNTRVGTLVSASRQCLPPAAASAPKPAVSPAAGGERLLGRDDGDRERVSSQPALKGEAKPGEEGQAAGAAARSSEKDEEGEGEKGSGKAAPAQRDPAKNLYTVVLNSGGGLALMQQRSTAVFDIVSYVSKGKRVRPMTKKGVLIEQEALREASLHADERGDEAMQSVFEEAIEYFL